MAKLVVGIYDLATLHPEVADEEDGLDPFYRRLTCRVNGINTVKIN